jgi:hypothetical protein
MPRQSGARRVYGGDWGPMTGRRCAGSGPSHLAQKCTVLAQKSAPAPVGGRARVHRAGLCHVPTDDDSDSQTVMTTFAARPTPTGAEIRARRLALGDTQQALATAAKMTTSYLSAIENGWEPRSHRPRHALDRLEAELARRERLAARTGAETAA